MDSIVRVWNIIKMFLISMRLLPIERLECLGKFEIWNVLDGFTKKLYWLMFCFFIWIFSKISF